MYEEAFKNIDDVLWKDAGCSTELDYAEQSSWILFLKWLDDYEKEKETKASLENKQYNYNFNSLHFFTNVSAITSTYGYLISSISVNEPAS